MAIDPTIDFTQVTKFNTGVGEIKVISFEEFIERIHSEKAYQIIEQYNATTKMKTDNGDDVYCRNFEKVGEATPEYLKKQFIDAMERANELDKESDFAGYGGYTSSIFNVEKLDPIVVQDAAVTCLEHFGFPTHLVKFDENTYAVVDLGIETIRLKMLDEKQGALCLYAPKRCALIKIKERKKPQAAFLVDGKPVAYTDNISYNFTCKPIRGIEAIPLKFEISEVKCECGKEKHGFMSHSTWCLKYKK